MGYQTQRGKGMTRSDTRSEAQERIDVKPRLTDADAVVIMSARTKQKAEADATIKQELPA